MPPVFKPESAFRKPYCPRNHFKPEVGIDPVTRGCWSCCLQRWRNSNRRYRSKNRTFKMPTQHQDARGIRELREYLGLTRYAFSRALGVPPQSVINWETGAQKMRCNTAEKLAPIVLRLKRERGQEILAQEQRRADIQRHDSSHEGYKTHAA